MKKKIFSKVLAFFMIVGLMAEFLPMTILTANAADETSHYGVNMESRYYETNMNPYYANFWGECTWYVWGRAMEKCGIDLSFFRGTGNAETWYNTAAKGGYPGIFVGTTPQANSIAVFQGYGSKTRGIGHVVFVESVEGSTVNYTEGNRYDNNGAWHKYFEDSFDMNNPVLSPNNARWEQRLVGFIYLDPAATIRDGWYTLAPQCAPGARLDVAGGSTESEANIQIYEQNGTPAQQFLFTYLGNGYYCITSKASEMALDVCRGGTASGTNVWQYQLNGTGAQEWKVEPVGDGYYRLIPRINTGLCLDVKGAGNASRTNVQVYDRNNTPAQNWKLTPSN